jgi:hypothetical protein
VPHNSLYLAINFPPAISSKNKYIMKQAVIIAEGKSEILE